VGEVGHFCEGGGRGGFTQHRKAKKKKKVGVIRGKREEGKRGGGALQTLSKGEEKKKKLGKKGTQGVGCFLEKKKSSPLPKGEEEVSLGGREGGHEQPFYPGKEKGNKKKGLFLKRLEGRGRRKAKVKKKGGGIAFPF